LRRRPRRAQGAPKGPSRRRMSKCIQKLWPWNLVEPLHERVKDHNRARGSATALRGRQSSRQKRWRPLYRGQARKCPVLRYLAQGILRARRRGRGRRRCWWGADRSSATRQKVLVTPPHLKGGSDWHGHGADAPPARAVRDDSAGLTCRDGSATASKRA